jgi:hypothetical protein
VKRAQQRAVKGAVNRELGVAPAADADEIGLAPAADAGEIGLALAGWSGRPPARGRSPWCRAPDETMPSHTLRRREQSQR